MQGIYKVRNKTNNKIYIGSSVQIADRFLQHLQYAFNENRVAYKSTLSSAIRKYGKDSFEIILLEEVAAKEHLIEREQYYYDELKPEYNQGRPTEGGHPVTVPVYQIDINTLEILNEFDSLAQAQREVNVSRIVIGNVCNGKGNTAGGFYWCHKDKYDTWKPPVHGHSRPIYQVDKKTDKIIKEFPSTKIASEITGTNNKGINNVLTGRAKTAGGYKWKRKGD